MKSLFLIIILFIIPNSLNAQPQPLQHFSGFVSDVGFTPDSQFAIITRQTPGDDNLTSAKIFFWDINNKSVGQTVTSIPGNAVLDLDISNDGQFLCIASTSVDAYLWDLNTNQLKSKYGPHSISYDSYGSFLAAGVTRISISNNNKKVLTRGILGIPHLWNTDTGELLHSFGSSIDTAELGFSPNHKYIITGHFVWDINTFELIYTLTLNEEGKRYLTSPICFSKDGEFVFLGQESFNEIYIRGYGNDIKYFITMWDIELGELVKVFDDFPNFITDIDISPNGKYLLVSVDRGEIWILETESGTVLNKIFGNQKPVAFSQNGKFALTGTRPFGASLWLVEDLLGQSGVRDFELYK